MAEPTAAIARLDGGYNNGVYNSGSNPLGFSSGGHRVNLYPAMSDIVDAGAWVAENAGIVSDLETEIIAVAANDNEIVTVAGIAVSVATAAAIAANITSVAGISTNVTAVAGALTNINTVAANVSGINTVATNIAEILAAEGYADAAAASNAAAAISAAAAKRPVLTWEVDIGSTADSNPGTGVMRFSIDINAASPGATGFIYANKTAKNGGNAEPWLLTLDDSTTTTNRGEATYMDQADGSIWSKAVVTGTVVDATTYVKIPFTHVGHAGTMVDAHIFTFDWARSGDKGIDGLGAGDVIGPASATDGRFAVYDGATGKLIDQASFGPADLAVVATSGNSDDLTEGTTKKLLSAAERTKLSGIETAADVTDAGNVGSAINGATGKTTPVDADTMSLIDSAASNALKKVTWANVKATVGSALGAMINAVSAKTTLTDADIFGIGDSAASNGTKKITWANVFAALGPKLAAGTDKTTLADADDFLISDSAASDAAKKVTWANFFLAIGPKIAAATAKTTPVDADTLLIADSAASSVPKSLSIGNLKGAILPAGSIYGLTLSNSGVDAVNDIAVDVGAAINSTGTTWMSLAATRTKRLDAAWVVGTNQGGRDTGSIADGTWHVFLIMRPDTGVVDVLFSLSATAPTLPANYTVFRRIGSIVRASASILAFVQVGDEFVFAAPAEEYNVTNPGNAAVTVTSNTPSGIPVLVHGVLRLNTTTTSASYAAFISTLSVADLAPSTTANFTTLVSALATAGTYRAATPFSVMSSSGSYRLRLSASDANMLVIIMAYGWTDRRGRD